MHTKPDTEAEAIEPTDCATKSLLVALDIDGTIADTNGIVSRRARQAIGVVRSAGHHVVLATGRSLVGLPPITRQLGMSEGWVVASNGALLIHFDAVAANGFVIEEARMFDPSAVIHRAMDLVPGVVIGAEDLGVGWRFSHHLPDANLSGPQSVVSVADLCATPATKVAFTAPGIHCYAEELAATGASVTSSGTDWLDVVAAGVSKATTLEQLRHRLGVGSGATVAVGDGANDIAMLRWAETSFAMANATVEVRGAATATCPSITDDGAADVLLSLLSILPRP